MLSLVHDAFFSLSVLPWQSKLSHPVQEDSHALLFLLRDCLLQLRSLHARCTRLLLSVTLFTNGS